MRPKRASGWWMVPLLALLGVGAARDIPLVDAVKQADVQAVRALLQQHVDVNATEPDGTTALHWAAYRDHTEIADLLIRAGAHVHAGNRNGVTPLSLACTNGNAAIITRLLDAGADPNTALRGGETALMTAARTGNAAAVTALLAHGANVEARESTRGQTALMWAAAEGHAAAITLLTEAGADVAARSQPPAAGWAYGTTAANPNPGMKALDRLDRFTPLLFAAQAGHIDAVRALLEGGADVNEGATDGTSALLLAIGNVHFELAALLVDYGADVNASGPGWTALHQLARARNPSIGQWPPPVPTGRMNSLDLAKKLIAHGADVNARATTQIGDWYAERVTLKHAGATPYVVAAKSSDFELMRVLLASGADPLAKTKNGTTALMAAAGVALTRVNEDGGTNADAVEAVKIVLDAGADVNAVNDVGDTALHGAAFRGENAIVELLVNHGAKLDVKNKKGFTPLMVANGEEVKGMNLQPKPWTVAVLRQMMIDRGLPPMMASDAEKFSAEKFAFGAK